MGRVNKTTEGVFVNVVGTSKERSSYDQFITRNNDTGGLRWILSGRFCN